MFSPPHFVHLNLIRTAGVLSDLLIFDQGSTARCRHFQLLQNNRSPRQPLRSRRYAMLGGLESFGVMCAGILLAVKMQTDQFKNIKMTEHQTKLFERMGK